MGLVIILSKFIKVKQCEGRGEMTYTGFLAGFKIYKIEVLGLNQKVEKDVMYLVTLKGAKIVDKVLCGEAIKIKKLDEVNF